MFTYDHLVRSLGALGVTKFAAWGANKAAKASQSRLNAVDRSGALPIDSKESARYSAVERLAVATKCSATWANRASYLADKSSWGVYLQQLAPIGGYIVNYIAPGYGDVLILTRETQNKTLLGSMAVGVILAGASACSSCLSSRRYSQLAEAQSKESKV